MTPLDRAPVYNACDSVGNEFSILDDRKDKSQSIQLNDHVQVYGEFAGIGIDVNGEADTDNLVIYYYSVSWADIITEDR